MELADTSGQLVRLRIDPDVCIGHGACVTSAPDLFEWTEARQGHVVDVDASVAWERAEPIVWACPVSAIAAIDALTERQVFP